MSESLPDNSENPSSAPTLDREYLGHVWVDSGKLMLVDPTYSEDVTEDEIDKAFTDRRRAAMLMDGMAAVFRSGLRTGRYPVYVRKFPNGAISTIEIELNENSAATST